MSTAADGNRPQPMPQPGGVLHQRRSAPSCTAKVAAVGALVIGAIGYFTLGATKAKPEGKPGEVARVAEGSGRGQ